MRRRAWLAVALVGRSRRWRSARCPAGAERDPERQPDRLPRRRHQPAQAPPRTNGRRSRCTSRAASTPPTARRSRASTGSSSNSPGGACSSRHGLAGLPPGAAARAPTASQAIASCGGALVGRGKLYAKIFVPNQAPFGVHANLLAFNGQTKVGRPAVLVHAYTTDPPVSFVIPFAVHRQKGAFRTVLVTTLRRSVGTWPHVSNFRIEVARNFIYHGKRTAT